MHFIRLAGCPVGHKATEEAVTALGNTYAPIPVLNNGHRASYCKTWDGRRFVCDTDFSCHTHKNVYEIIGETWEKHICLTGGEPLIHQRALVEQGFFAEANAKGIMIHVETSGTVVLMPTQSVVRMWIAVAPKWGYKENMISLADEIKFLVDDDFDMKKVSEVMQWASPSAHIFLSPINDEKVVSQKHVDKALALLPLHPTWRLSAQWHKFLGVR